MLEQPFLWMHVGLTLLHQGDAACKLGGPSEEIASASPYIFSPGSIAAAFSLLKLNCRFAS